MAAQVSTVTGAARSAAAGGFSVGARYLRAQRTAGQAECPHPCATVNPAAGDLCVLRASTGGAPQLPSQAPWRSGIADLVGPLLRV
jgi:hypothetical protein